MRDTCAALAEILMAEHFGLAFWIYFIYVPPGQHNVGLLLKATV